MKYFKKHKLQLLQWPSQFPDLKITENMWVDLKHALSAR